MRDDRAVANTMATDVLQPQEPLHIVNSDVLARTTQLREQYRGARPFPHIVIDDFLRHDVAEAIASQFPGMEQMPKVFREPMTYKGQLSDIDRRWPVYSGVFAALQSQPFRELMSELSGIDELLPDPILAGAGLHQSPKSGFLDVHVDANFHPLDLTKHRRLNLLIYVTPSWQTEWGGQIELWSDRRLAPDKVALRIEPRFNRAVLFSTTRTSWHGVAPIVCPPNISRRSLALYYYTHSRPEHELYKDSSVIWHSKNPLKKLVYPVMNAAIAVLKPYSKHLGFLRRNAFDAARSDDKK